MKKLIAILMVFGSFGAYAQGVIEGKVFEVKEDAPSYLANVWVEVGGVMKGTSTDDRGKFRIKPLAPGTYTVHVKVVGYPETKVTDVVVHKDNITRVENIVLTPSDLPEFIVVWREPVIDFDEPGKMKVKGAEMQETAHAKNIGDFVATLGDGIYQADTNQPLYFRGGRADAVKYIQDGMNAREGINLPGLGIGEVAVYTSGIPAKYGDVLSGVIVVETKSYFDLYNQAN